MSHATCKTCGGNVPNHKPSLIDPNGIGHPGHKVQGNDLAASDRNDTPVRANPPTSSTPTENTDIDTIFDEYFPIGTVVPNDSIDDGKAEMMTKLMEYHRNKFKAAIEQKLKSEILKARDSEQNTLFSILRHLHVKHDAKAIMRVRKEWDESAALQASKEGKEALCIESWYKCEFYVQGALPSIVDSICSLPHRMSNLSLAMVTDLASPDSDTNTSSRRASDGQLRR